MKKLISTVLALLMVMSMIPMLALSISATSADVIISNSTELIDFANGIANGTTYNGQTIEITNDIELPEGTAWPDMAGKNFAGTIDGNGHTISGLHMTRNGAHSGFFGNISHLPEDGQSATVKNLSITESSIITDNTDTQNTHHCGGIFGRVNTNGTCVIENVYTDIDITMTRTTGNRYGIGGFIGLVTYGASVNITNCVAVGDVNVDPDDIASVGGIVGYVQSRTSSPTNLSITDCAVYGNVNAGGKSTGLIVGSANCTDANGVTTVNLKNVIAAGNNNNSNAERVYGAFVGNIPSKDGNTATVNISSSICINSIIVGNGSADTSDYSCITLNELKTTVPTGFKTWIIDASLNNGYPLPINVAYMLKHVNDDTATDGYNTAFAGYQSTDFVDNKGNIRLIGVVNDMDGDGSLDDEYIAVGFEVEMISPKTWKNKTDNGAAPKITTVYSSVLEGETPKSASDLGGDYIFVATITGVKQNVGDVTFVVKTFHDTVDGRVYDDAYVITYNTGAVAS